MFRRSLLIAMLGIAATAVATQPAFANLITMVDRNTEVHTDVNSVGDFFDWTVDGTDHLGSEWFWIRANNDTQETKITALSNKTILHYDGNLEPGEDRLFLRWQDPQGRFEISLDQVLTGGAIGSAISDVTQTIHILNTTDEPIEINLFQLADFDILGTREGDTVEVLSDNVIRQSELSSSMVETFSHGGASAVTTEVALGSSLRISLEDTSITNLSSNPGPLTGDEVKFAVQWTTTIPVNGSFTITKDMFISAPDSLVPEPASATLLSLAGLALLAVRRRRG